MAVVAFAFSICALLGAGYVMRQLSLPGLYKNNIVVDFFMRRFGGRG